jgi:hypothetical protein
VKKDVMEIDDNETHNPINIDEDINLPKREMKVADLSQVNVRKYKYHDKYERKQNII